MILCAVIVHFNFNLIVLIDNSTWTKENKDSFIHSFIHQMKIIELFSVEL